MSVISKYINARDLKRSLLMAVWFMFLTFPIMVIKVNTVTDTVEWRWYNMAVIGVASFILSYVWKILIDRREGKAGLKRLSSRKPKKRLP